MLLIMPCAKVAAWAETAVVSDICRAAKSTADGTTETVSPAAAAADAAPRESSAVDAS